MITLALLLYAAICVAVFKVFRVRAGTWSISSAALVGLIAVGGVVLVMNFNHPFTNQARIAFITTPIFSTVSGRVVEVPVQPNVPVKQGDILFRLDPAPFQAIVEQRSAALEQARQAAEGLKASLDEANAKVAEAQAARDRAKQEYERYRRGNAEARARRAPEPFSKLDEENRRGEYLESEATLVAARAAAENARLLQQSRIAGVNTEVVSAGAALRHAEFELAEATVRAPADGYITQLFLRPGMAAMPMPIRPVMVFVHDGDRVFVASFAQNVVTSIRSGHAAEIAFDSVPGRVFQGRVKNILPAIAEGQLQPGGDLVAAQPWVGRGNVAVVIDIVDDLSAYDLPAGSAAQVAVYSDRWPEIALARRILLRMKSWLNYLSIR